MDATNEDVESSLELLPNPPQPGQTDTTPAESEGSWLGSAVINTYSAALLAATALLLSHQPIHDAGPLRSLMPQAAMFVVMTFMWAVVVWAPVMLHHRGNTYLFVLTEVPMVIGLVFLAPGLFVISCICAEAFVFTVLRRQAPMKVLFNVASSALAAALTVLVYREILGAASPVSFRGWAAMAIALTVQSVTTTILVKIVIKLAGQTTERRSPIQFTMETLLMAASICLAFVVLDTAWYDPWATIPLFLVAGLIIVAYRGYTRLTLRFASLQRLYDFTQAVGTASLEPTSMSAEVLREMCGVMRARRAELILAEPSGIPRRVLLDENDTLRVEPITLDESSIVTEAIVTAAAALHNSAEETPHAGADPVLGAYRDCVVAPLLSGTTAIGAVVVLDRDEELDSFDGDDLRLFETLAVHAAASLERARLVEELRFEVDSKSHQATHDALTGLPNRVLFLTRAAAALNESAGVAIVLLDVDRFKDVNDTLGHALGDRLLCEVSERLQRAASGRVTVARLGGDEFALVIPDVVDAAGALAVVRELSTEMARPIEMDGITLAVKASAGVALAPEHGDDVALLLQRADIAMYVAKERRSTVELYSLEHDQSMRRWLMLGGLLTHALETGTELSVVYQPIADVESGRVVKVEALIRWCNPDQGQIPPDEFIGIAEQMGLMSQISEFVLSESCKHLSTWRRAGVDIGIGVNVSGGELADGSLVERVERNLRAYNLPAGLLTIEVTETEVMDDLTQASDVLDELAALGVQIAIDDYGTGYSSLAYIHQLPVQQLKIDRSFVTNLPSEHSNSIIVRSSIAMAHSLGLTVIAEGAEDALACALLADADCDYIQGFHLSKPMRSADLLPWLLEGGSLQFKPLPRRRRGEVRAPLTLVRSAEHAS